MLCQPEQETSNSLELRFETGVLRLANTPSNQKVLLVIARYLTDAVTGKPQYSFQQLSEVFGHPDRQWSHNYLREFKQRDEDMLAYLQRTNCLKEAALEPIQQQVLQHPLVSLRQQYAHFQQLHPALSLSYATFLEYVRPMDSCQLLRRMQQLVTTEEVSPDSRVYLGELLENLELPASEQKPLLEVFPELEVELEVEEVASEQRGASKQPGASDSVEWELPSFQRYLLVAVLYASGLSQQMLALLFGVSRTSIHHWLVQYSSWSKPSSLRFTASADR